MSTYTFKNSIFSSHQKILSYAGAPHEGKNQCLDIGCSSGYLAQCLVLKGWSVTAIDINIPNDSLTKYPHVKFLEGDFLQMTNEKSYDLVIAGDVIEHLADPHLALSKIHDMIKNDGKVILSIPNAVNIYMRLHVLLGKFNYAERGLLDRSHLRFFTANTAKDMILESGFRVDRITETPLPFYLFTNNRNQHVINFLMKFTTLVTKVFPKLLAYQFVYQLKKR